MRIPGLRVLALFLAGCATAAPSVRAPLDGRGQGPQILRGRGSRTASALALADRLLPLPETLAFVADEDDRALHVFTTSPPREIAVRTLDGTPSQVLVSGGGRVYVALRDRARVAVFEPTADERVIVERGSIAVAGEPVSLAMTADESTLLVGSGWTHTVSAYSLASQALRYEIDVDREPRSILVSRDGSKARVTHAVGGRLTSIELATGNTRAKILTAPALPAFRSGGERIATQGFAMVERQGKVLAPLIVEDPTPPTTYYGAGSVSFGVAAVEEVSDAVTIATPTRDKGRRPSPATDPACNLPRSAAFVPDGDRIVVACAGRSELAVLDADTLAVVPHASGRMLTDSPSAVAYEPSTHDAVVWSQFGRTLSLVSLADFTAPPVSVFASGSFLPDDVARGRRLFHDVEGKTSADGRACASCHVDGRDDGLVWKTPEGPRQTPMLAARLGDTAPFGWTRAEPTFHAYVKGTTKRLRGSGMTDAELDDLMAYVGSLAAPARSDRQNASLVGRGAEVFASPVAGCSTCHSGPALTDGLSHQGGAVRDVFALEVATPSLRFVGGTAPYFHDGRYATLRELVTSADPNMGRARVLPQSDQDALVAYLSTL